MYFGMMKTKNWEGKEVDMDLSIKPGDKVRSYDFPDTMHDTSRPPCFVEGIVVDMGSKFAGIPGSHPKYKIKATRCVFAGKETQDFAEFYYPPQNGLDTWNGQCHGVVKVVE